MSFAADLKDFASNFRDTYKSFKTDWKDEAYREQVEALRGAREEGERAAAGATPGGTSSRALAGASGAIQAVESGGNAAAKGPVIASGAYEGDRAYGLHQVMGKNIPVWTKEVLGRSYTPEEFVKDEQAQHRVFNAKFGQYAKRYGSAEDAASAWFTGLPYAEAVRRGRGDQLGTRVQDYVRKFKSGLGRQAALDTEDDETVPVVYAARGGVIPSGRALSLDTTENESAGSNPVTRDVYDAERSSMSDDDFDPRELVDVEGARAAVAGGLKFMQRTLGLETHHAAVPQAATLNPDGVTALQTNAGAPSRDEIKVIHQTVDPKGELPPELREIAGYNAVYKYWNALGQPQKADRAAAQMLGAAKRAAALYGAAALAVDDPVKRAQVIAKGYNELIPDGDTVKITGKGEGGGAKFEVHDAQGRVSEKGVLAMDDMIKMATGMSNGTEYLRGMVNFATAAPTAKEKELEKRSAARTAFEERIAGQDDRDYVSTLSEEDRKAYMAMHPTERKEFAQRHERRQQEEARDIRFNERMAVGAENMDRKEALDLAKFSVRHGMWERTREQVMTQHEQKLAQLQAQEAGRNNRFDQSQEARLKRQREIDQRILDKRTAGRDGAGVKLTPKEAAENRRVSAVDLAEQQGTAAIEEATPLTPGGSEGAMTERRRRTVEAETAPIRAQAGYERMPEKARDMAVSDVEAIDTHIKKTAPKLAATDQLWARRIASDISAAGGQKMLNTEAADYVLEALNPKNPEPRVLPGGMVQLRADLPPVRMTGESLIALAQLRQRAMATMKPTGGASPRPAALEVPFSRSTYDDPRSVNRRRALDYGIR